MTAVFHAVVLDSEGLSGWIRRDRAVMATLQELFDMGADLVVSANIIIEVTHAKADMPRVNWLLSQVHTEPVTKSAAKAAARLLADAGLHGHEHAIDATVAEAALRQSTPVAILTSDADDMRMLCGRRVHLIVL
ncbi:MAG: DNA-binding protein [Pseudonocardiaceae bacterium]|nr:DNA-binding protein [Pseudonocardiaceae bacterium]